MHKVKSSNIEEIGHEGKTLTVKFTNGGTYEYDGVPADMLHKILTAESPGTFFHQNIKGKFPHAKKDEPK
jgi:hypothetical protein